MVRFKELKDSAVKYLTSVLVYMQVGEDAYMDTY